MRLASLSQKCCLQLGEPAMVIASSDMNHYENDSVTRAKDRRAIDQVLALDPRGLYDTVRRGKYQHVRLRARDGHAHGCSRAWELLGQSWSGMRRRETYLAIATWLWATPESRCIEYRVVAQEKRRPEAAFGICDHDVLLGIVRLSRRGLPAVAAAWPPPCTAQCERGAPALCTAAAMLPAGPPPRHGPGATASY